MPIAAVLLVVGLFIGLAAGYGVVTSDQSGLGGQVASTTTSTKTLTSVKSLSPSTTTQTVTASGTNATITMAGTDTTVTTTAPAVTSTQTQTATITTKSTTTQTSVSTLTSTTTTTVTTSPPYPGIATVEHVPFDIQGVQGVLTANCTVGPAPGPGNDTYITLTDTTSTPLYLASMSFSFSSVTYTAPLGCELGASGSSTDVASIFITSLPSQPEAGDPFAGAFNLASGVQLQFAGNFASTYRP